MSVSPWRLALYIGVTAAVFAAPLGGTVQTLVLLMAIAAAAVVFGARLHRHRPTEPLPWLLITASVGLFFVQHGLTTLFPAIEANTTSGFTFASLVGIAAYASAIAGLWKLNQLRDGDRHPAHRLDALIVAGSFAIAASAYLIIPVLANRSLPAGTQITSALFTGLDVLIFFTIAILAFAPGRKSIGFWMLGGGLLSVISHHQLLIADHASIAFTGSNVLAYLTLSLGFVAVTAAGLHPETTDVTKSSDAHSGGMSIRRFALMTVAIASPLMTLLLGSAEYAQPVVLAWLAMLVLIVWRFQVQIQTNTSVVRLDAIVSAAATKFAAASTRERIYETGLNTAREIAGGVDPGAVASLVMNDNGTWKQVATTGAASKGLRAQAKNDLILQLFLGGRRSFDGAEKAVQQRDVAGRSLVFVPLVAQNQVRGALIVETAIQLPHSSVDAFRALCANLGLVLGVAALSEDLHQQRNNKRFRALLENTNEAIFIVSASGLPLFTSAAAERILEGSGQSANVFQAIHIKDRSALASMVHNAPQGLRALENQQTLECRLITNSGTDRWVEFTATDMTQDSEIGGIVLTAHDITERKMLEADIRHRVLYDDLTGIPNRALLRERADHALSMRRSDSNMAALLFIDVDDFEILAGSLGAGAGEDILKVIAFRLDNYVRGHDTAARLSGNTFAVLIQDITSGSDIETVAQRLLSAVQREVDFDGRQVRLRARVGVCVAQPDYDSGIFLRNTEVALHEAKQNTHRIAYFNESMSVSAVDRMELRHDLERAVERSELDIHYQPIINLNDRSVAGFEALLRWNHPQRGALSPAAFVPLAEETGLMNEIGAWVLHRACSQLAYWRRVRSDLNLQMSINVSPSQLMERSFIEMVTRTLHETRTIPSALIFELTEADQFHIREIGDRLSQLRALGVGIAADDFGSGFASYVTQDELPFTVAKIDRSLVSSLEANFEKASRQLRSVISVAHAAKLAVSAEGIEDAAQCDLLTSLGCERGQGYYFGRPAPAEEAQDILTYKSSNTVTSLSPT